MLSLKDKIDARVTYADSSSTSSTSDYAKNSDTTKGVKDYNDATRTIQIGYAGAGLTVDNLNHIAGYTNNGTKIKDVSKEVLKS